LTGFQTKVNKKMKKIPQRLGGREEEQTADHRQKTEGKENEAQLLRLGSGRDDGGTVRAGTEDIGSVRESENQGIRRRDNGIGG
jgi:hypothetical protein